MLLYILPKTLACLFVAFKVRPTQSGVEQRNLCSGWWLICIETIIALSRNLLGPRLVDRLAVLLFVCLWSHSCIVQVFLFTFASSFSYFFWWKLPKKVTDNFLLHVWTYGLQTLHGLFCCCETENVLRIKGYFDHQSEGEPPYSYWASGDELVPAEWLERNENSASWNVLLASLIHKVFFLFLE
jgi:hypothetical protein